MRALVATTFGGPETMAVIDLDPPAPLAGQVAVRVHAAGVNPTDLAVRAGWMQPYFPTTPPVVLGLDLAGTVAAVGEDVVDLQPGDAVVGHTLVEGMRAGTSPSTSSRTGPRSSASPKDSTSFGRRPSRMPD